MKLWLCVIILALLAGAAFADPLPEFRLPDETGKNVALSDLVGKGPLIVDFWADYCQPCKLAMPHLDALARKYDSLTVVLVSLDAPKAQAKARAFLKSKDYKFVTLFDPDKTLAKKLNVVNPPHTFIVNKEGEIVWSHLGFGAGAEKEYEAQVRQVMGLEEEKAGEEKDCDCPPDCPGRASKEACGCED